MRRDKRHCRALIDRGLRTEERQRVEMLLRDSRAEDLGFLDIQLLRDAFDTYLQDRTTDSELLYMPLCLEAWLRSISNLTTQKGERLD